MKTLIGVYNSHEEAIDAIKELKKDNYPTKNLSVVGKVNENPHQDEESRYANVAGTEVGTSVLIGSTVGILTGVGVFAIPGLGFLFGAGALAGAIAGFDIALIGGGIISALTIANIHKEDAQQYDEYIKSGKFLLIGNGTKEENEKAQQILEAHGKHSGLNTY